MSSDTSLEIGITRQGSLLRYSTSKKKWIGRYYVLYSCEPQRLDWYDDAVAFQSNPTMRMSLFIEEILQIERFTPEKKTVIEGFQPKKFMLKLQNYRSTDTADYLAAKNENDANEWLSSINQLVVAARMKSRDIRTDCNLARKISDDCYQPSDFSAISFNVEVDDTAAANLCELYGRHKLVLSSNHMTLVNMADEPVLSWEYCNIRRYGYGAERFTVEGGHKAGKGQGLFLFKSCDGRSIREACETKMLEFQRLRQQNLDKDSYSYVDVVLGKESSGAAGNEYSVESTSVKTDQALSSPPEPLHIKPRPLKKPSKVTASSSSPRPEKLIDSVSCTTNSTHTLDGLNTTSTTANQSSRPPPAVLSRLSSKSSSDDAAESSVPGVPATSTVVDLSSSSSRQQQHSKTPIVTKFSQVIGQMNKLKVTKTPPPPTMTTTKTGRDERRYKASKTENQSKTEGLYDELDLSSAAGNNNPLSRSSRNGAPEGYDPTHVYGPIETIPSSARGRGGSPALIESEYAELRT